MAIKLGSSAGESNRITLYLEHAGLQNGISIRAIVSIIVFVWTLAHKLAFVVLGGATCWPSELIWHPTGKLTPLRGFHTRTPALALSTPQMSPLEAISFALGCGELHKQHSALAITI